VIPLPIIFLTAGRWVVDVAQEFPTAHVLGIDISPVTRINAPNNCEFQLGNINHDLAKFDAGSFDLVHSRSSILLLLR